MGSRSDTAVAVRGVGKSWLDIGWRIVCAGEVTTVQSWPVEGK